MFRQHAGSFQLRLLLMGVTFVLCLTDSLSLLAPLAAVVTMASGWGTVFQSLVEAGVSVFGTIFIRPELLGLR